MEAPAAHASPLGACSRAHVYTHRGLGVQQASGAGRGPPRVTGQKPLRRQARPQGEPRSSALQTRSALCPRELSCDPTTTCFLCSHEDPSMNRLAIPRLLSVLFKQPPSLLQVLSLRTFERQILDSKTSRPADPARAGVTRWVASGRQPHLSVSAEQGGGRWSAEP